MWSATFEAANVRHEHGWRVWQKLEDPGAKDPDAGRRNQPLPPGRSRTVRVSAAWPCRQVQLGDDLVRPAAGRWKIAGCSANEEPAAPLKSSALDSACTALSPNATLKLSLIFGHGSPLHPGPR